ncbi:GNAT family N-acetyltransferase [Flavobacterium sp. WV_118_3]|jgi:ribosomal protein S18 acetylase RimI-like enzyme|uniref:GNAT family N-acetyltransferase n=1 Tax=Flavobacterium sp. WV_118_3 TaxID=3151764 RepID=UPI0012CCC90F|nr:N-acetyltransferase [Flavobacterium sp.]HRB72141.1 GNAT family N-acetyltransferase [Flavobacterium sp.]
MTIITVTSQEQLEIVRSLAYTIWPDAYGAILSEAQLDYMLDQIYAIPALEQQRQNGQQFVLAEEDGVYYGFASFQVNYKEGKTKLHKIYVLPQTQGKGVGKSLLQYVESTVDQNKNSALLLNVNRFNKAIDFYRKQGFEVIGEEDIAIGEGYLMEDYIMEKKIK